ncbi:hypothetical protein EON65_07630 [archaeon]|nr:MAG: hypothetical protein EON65_07630 [archaeon]
MIGNVFALLFKAESDIPDEKMEEFRMLSGFKPREIHRLKKSFLKYTENRDLLAKESFLSLEPLVNNPLKERIALCFGYDEEVVELDFQAFLCGLALFNSPGQREQKLKTAFRIQDFDNDGVINKNDLVKYLEALTSGTLDEKQISEVADQVLKETASDALQENITYNDFQRVVAPQDFQAKLRLPF